MIPEGLIYRVKENLSEKQKGPYCIDLIVNDSCNLGCFYCSGSTSKGSKEKLSREALIKILDSARNLAVKEISLTSLVGEPTAFKDIKFLMEEIKKRGFVGTLLTNGSMLDSGFASFLRQIQWDILILSLDSFTADIQYKSRPDIARNRYLDRIIEFLECTAKENPGINMDLNMVVNKFNYSDIRNYFKKAQSYGIKNITLLKLVKMNDNYGKFALDDNQVTEFKNMLKDIDSPVHFNRLEWFGQDCAGVNDSKSSIIKTGGNLERKCYFHLYKILVDCDGGVLKCNGDTQKTRFCVSENKLEEIYDNLLEAYAELRVDPPCWDICCSPIKSLNQQIGYYLEKM